MKPGFSKDPGTRLRPGRPTDPNWVKHPKVPMSEATLERLERLAGELSTPGRRVSPMQVAAQLLETSVERLVEEGRRREVEWAVPATLQHGKVDSRCN